MDIKKYEFAKDAVTTGLAVTGTILVILLGALTVPQELTIPPFAKCLIIGAAGLLLISGFGGSMALVKLIRLAGNGSKDDENSAVFWTNVQLATFFIGLILLVGALTVRLIG